MKTKESKNYAYIKHFTTQCPTFTLDISANSRVLHIYYTCLFHECWLN